ncbi:MAG: transglycosylase domain-containing protein [Actinomycetota bacterium]|nr:transglycosylase domain-containing protein [Actinomycetota bacterium]
MLSASDLLFGRGARGSTRAFSGPSGWDDPIVRGVTALAVASVLVPVLVIGILAVSLLAMPFSGSLPSERPSVESRMTRVFDSTGVEIANFRRFETSLPVARGSIPPVLVDAVLAVEDQRFYQHKGVDSRGVFRAFWADVKGGGYIEGGSTITQQYVRLAYTGQERSVGRKLREAILAGRVEKKLSKDEILYRYLSRAYFGSGAYGIGAAAETYFNKPVRDVSLTEAAMLAGLLSAPSQYDPRANPGEAEYQRQRVLGKMVDQGRITQQQYNEALPMRVITADNVPRVGAVPATIVQPARTLPMKYPWFSDYVRGYLTTRYGADAVYSGGLRVETSLDPEMQAKAEAAVTEALKGTQAPLEMALVALEPKTGLVRAAVGGRDFGKSQVNLALGACPDRSDDGGGQPVKSDGPVCVAGGGSGRQPGSAFKPITLAEALEDGISLDKTYRGSGSYTYPNCRGQGCTVRNVESGGYGYLNLRQATAYSVNTVYAQLVQDAGVKDTAEMAHRLGLTMINPEGKLPSGEPYGPSLTLGAAEVSPLDMAAAYGVFGARGMQFPASPVVRVTGPDGKVLEDNTRRQGKRVLSETVADTMNDVLKGVIASGTGRAADISRPSGTAGKTGTSENHSDAWFVGYTPELSTAVWMGYADSQKPLVNIKDVPRVYGGTIPAKTWQAFMSAALEGKPTSDFAPPRAILPPAAPASTSPTPSPRPSPPVTSPPVVEPVPTEPAPVPPYVYQPPAYPGPTYPPDTAYTVPPQTYIPYTPPETYNPPPTYVPPATQFQPPQYVPSSRRSLFPGAR